MQHFASLPPLLSSGHHTEARTILARKWPSYTSPFSAQSLPASLTYKTQGLCRDQWTPPPPASLAPTGPWTHWVSSTLWPSLLPFTLSGGFFPQTSHCAHSQPHQAYSDDTFSKRLSWATHLKPQFLPPTCSSPALIFPPEFLPSMYFLLIYFIISATLPLTGM